MVIKIGKEVNTWAKTMEFLVDNIELAKKGHSGFYFSDISIEKFDLTDDPFKVCCYVNPKGKISSLRKQYLNKESLDQIFSGDQVEVSMVGGPKWGSAAGNKHCMKSLYVNHSSKQVQINFRNSDFFKKFLVDIYFVEKILSEAGVKDYSYSCYFENLTLRTPFVYLFLNQVYNTNPQKVKEYLESDNPLMVEFLQYYKKAEGKTLNFKSLDRCRRRMKELTVYSLIREYIE